jgi:putative Mn2+ efflux pump MntP
VYFASGRERSGDAGDVGAALKQWSSMCSCNVRLALLLVVVALADRVLAAAPEGKTYGLSDSSGDPHSIEAVDPTHDIHLGQAVDPANYGRIDPSSNAHSGQAVDPTSTPKKTVGKPPPNTVAECVLLSLTASFDNGAVGFSLGLVGNADPVNFFRLNFVISVVGGVGAFCSSYVGMVLDDVAPLVAGFFAATIFAWLGCSEALAYYADEKSVLAELAQAGNAWKLALPLALDNMGSGVAGGLEGITPWWLLVGAFVSSFTMMSIGFFGAGFLRPGSGKEGGTNQLPADESSPLAPSDDQYARHHSSNCSCVDERVLAAAVFLGLAMYQAVEATRTAMDSS